MSTEPIDSVAVDPAQRSSGMGSGSNASTADAEYTMKIALTTLKHLGIGLYSNVPAVLSEVVANAYDADAENVWINIDRTAGTVTILDDGYGMSKEDMNQKYLNVGWDKRKNEGSATPKNRHVMGRKGIGKLALFSIAEEIEVQSAKMVDGNTISNGFVMTAQGIEDAIKEDVSYKPTALDTQHLSVSKGTSITLRRIKSSLDATEAFLRRRLARRFSIIGAENGFTVTVNDSPIGIADRDYFSKIEYLWHIGDESEKYLALCTNVKNSEKVDGIIDTSKGYKITGWIGTIDEQKSIEEGNNTIVVLAWGKLIHEDLLKDMKETGVYASYLIGEIRADFLDADNEEDIATSDRQSLRETDPRFNLLKDYIRSSVLKKIQSKWTDWRNEGGLAKATADNPNIKQWYDGLKNDNKRYAKALLGKIQTFPISDENYRRELYRHSILAFETLALKQNLAVLDKISTPAEMEMFGSLFASIDELEETHYYQIVKGRVEVLKKFEVIAANAKEKIVHDHVYTHLWLLDPSWERASTDARTEQTVTREFDKINANLTPEEASGRIDIRYRTAAGKHIIIELKKGDRQVTAFELAEQVTKYQSALGKCLETLYPGRPKQIEAICLVGPLPEPSDNLERVENILKAVDARYITYDTLIDQTRKSYHDYLEAEKKISAIQALIDSI